MDIPIWPLNLTAWITYEHQKVDIQIVNLQPIVQEASEQMEPPRGSQSICRKADPAENSEPTAFLGRRKGFGTMSEGIAGLFVGC
jgi:hypothetical protein